MRLNYEVLTKEHADDLRKSYTFLQDKSIVVYGYIYDLPFPNEAYFIIGKTITPQEASTKNIGIFQYLRMYGSSAQYKGVVNMDGKETIQRKYIDIKPFYLDLGYVRLQAKGGKYGVSKLTGDIVCDIAFDHIYPFSEYVFAVEKNGKVGFLDQNGHLVIPFLFDALPSLHEEFYCFKNGKARVRQTIDDDHYEFYIDHYGNQVSDKYYIDTSLDYNVENETTYNSSDILDAFEGDASNMWNID